MNTKHEQHRDYQRIKLAIEFLNTNPSAELNTCAKHLNLNPEHFQKLFTRWAGVSPKQYTQYLKKEHAIHLLQTQNKNMQTISHESGLSGAGRLHDLIVTFYGMTPGEYASQGKSLDIHYGFHATRFGDCLLASTQKGICKLAFFDNEDEKNTLLGELKEQWSLAKIVENTQQTEHLFKNIFNQKNNSEEISLKLMVKGTPFQLKVWEALLKIPDGKLWSYQDVAQSMNQENATRAVSSAIARNQIALLIPCHRVIRQNGDFNQYRWGRTRKQAMIGWEASQQSLHE